MIVIDLFISIIYTSPPKNVTPYLIGISLQRFVDGFVNNVISVHSHRNDYYHYCGEPHFAAVGVFSVLHFNLSLLDAVKYSCLVLEGKLKFL